MPNPTTTIFIHETAIRVPDPYVEGHTATLMDAAILNQLYTQRFIGKVTWWLSRNADASDEVRAINIKRLAEEAATFDTNSGDASDPIYDEALQLAKDMILAKLAEDNLPAPQSLDMHAEELLEAEGVGKSIIDQARKRVEIRREVANSIVATLELT